MRAFLPLALAAFVGLSGCSSIRSGLQIDPGATFVLGGEQRGAFTVEILNVGGAAVTVSEVTASGDTLQVGAVAPEAATRVRFRAGSAALLANASGLPASLNVRITGDTALGMRYTE